MRNRETDYGREVFLFTLLLQALYIVGNYYKIPFLTSKPIFYAHLLAPMLVVVVALTWGSAIKYALLTSFVMPLLTSLVLIAVAAVSFYLNPDGTRLSQHIVLNLKTSFIVWLVLISMMGPGIALGVAIRFVWGLFSR